MSETVIDKVTLQRGLVYIRRHRRQIAVFITCLLISGLLWLMIKLNRDYVHTITFRVNITGQHDGQQFIPLQNDTVVLELKAQGYQLLFNELSMARSLDIDLSKTLLRQSYRPDILYISSHSLLARIATQFPVSTELLNVKPDTLFFRVSDIEYRWVPVVPDISIDFQENHMLYDTLIIKPDSVRIKGDVRILDEIVAIPTRRIDLKQVHKPFSHALNLINPNPGQIAMDVKEVLVSGRVVPAVNKIYIVPVQLPDTLKTVSGMPVNAELFCKLPVSELAGFNPNQIRISVSQVSREGGVLYGILAAEAPSFVKQLRISPEKIPLNTVSE